ncbi:acyl-CoA thioesterase [Bdellovibrio sp. HCB288]|uniref:acyl-CoA thioesterase n=1 Tax=Bdellovibrio sp. HCB288 TaxID=3394355 RepID=UPI0039B6E26D
MDFETRKSSSRTHVFKAVFPGETNHYNTLYGGLALNWMDEIAFIAATRFSRQRYVTVSSDRVNFNNPIPAGTIVELDAYVSKLGTTSLEVTVDTYCEDMYSNKRTKSMTGIFTLVAIDESRKAIPIKFPEV